MITGIEMVLTVIGSVLLVAAVTLGLRQINHSVAVSTCHSFAQQSGYQTKFADYTFWTYDCLAKTEGGKWISTSRLREEAN